MRTKFAIGCLTQWYEIDIVPDYITTLLSAVKDYDENDVYIDLKLSINQDLEKIDEQYEMSSIISNFHKQVERLKGLNVKVTVEENLVTIADYRRAFNNEYCECVDVLVWGESDMLLPKQAFTYLDHLHRNVETTKYLATFSICKMWDDSWKALEHPDFTNKQHSDSKKDWWGLNYDMTIEEMNSFNDKVEEPEVTLISPHKFNGCGLVIASEVVKSGVNIPHNAFFIHEDTAFMLMTQKVLGNIPQYHFNNILVVHNRKHKYKRNYIKGEIGNTVGQKRNSNEWYTKANKMCETNVYNLFNPTYKSFTWKDVFNSLKQ